MHRIRLGKQLASGVGVRGVNCTPEPTAPVCSVIVCSLRAWKTVAGLFCVGVLGLSRLTKCSTKQHCTQLSHLTRVCCGDGSSRLVKQAVAAT